jgi:D-tagatose-1,6-bisphosphate aldolase subunit GatZ/KbaZ
VKRDSEGQLMSYQRLNIAVHKHGQPVGMYSICSAHPFVLEAGVQQALQDGSPLLVESTCNRVNQEGGYTGKTPAEFGDSLWGIAEWFGFPREHLILGGDHLGPGPWQHEPVAQRMAYHRAVAKGLNPDRPNNLTAVVEL